MRPEFKFGLIGGLVLLVLGLGTYMSLKKPSEPLKDLPVNGPNASNRAPGKGAPGASGAPSVRTPLDSARPATPPTNNNNPAPPPSAPPATRPTPPVNEQKSGGVSLSGAALNPAPGLLPQENPSPRGSTIILPEVKDAAPAAGSGESALNPGKSGVATPPTPGSADGGKPKFNPARDERGTNSPSPTPTSVEPKTEKYTIQPGDRLSDIAKDHYGDAGLWRMIKEANPGLDENRLMVGKTIVLPPKGAKPTSTSSKSAGTSNSTDKKGNASATAKTNTSTERVPTPTSPSNGPKADSPTAPPRTEKKAAEAAKPATNSNGSAAGSKPTKAGGTYTVTKKDTLRSIARKELGSDKRWREIYELNKDKIKNPDILLEGMKLTLPAK